MMVALLDAAQEQRILGFTRRQESQAIDVERARAGEIADAELDMAGANHVERWIENGLADRHGFPQRRRISFECGRSPPAVNANAAPAWQLKARLRCLVRRSWRRCRSPAASASPKLPACGRPHAR